MWDWSKNNGNERMKCSKCGKEKRLCALYEGQCWPCRKVKLIITNKNQTGLNTPTKCMKCGRIGRLGAFDEINGEMICHRHRDRYGYQFRRTKGPIEYPGNKVITRQAYNAYCNTVVINGVTYHYNKVNNDIKPLIKTALLIKQKKSMRRMINEQRTQS
jgi:hypothetical protein